MRTGARGFSLLAALAVLAGCGQEGIAPASEVTVRLVLNVANTAASGRVDLRPHYRRSDQSRVDLPGTTIQLATGTQTVPLELDITDCLRDPIREPTGTGCPMRLAAVLRTDQGVRVDSQAVGPFDLVPGGTATTPTIILRGPNSLVVTPAKDTVSPGGIRQLSVQILDRQGGDLGAMPVTWATSAGTIATVSQTGVVTGVVPGTTTVTATLVADPTIQGTSQIAVRGVISFTLAADSVVIPAGDSAAPASAITVVGVPNTLRWRTRAPTIATVDIARGVVTAVAPGRAIIVAQPLADTTKADSLVAVVPGVVSVSLSSPTPFLIVTTTLQLTTSVVTAGGVSPAVTFQTSAPAVATVNPTGLVTAVGPGTAIIRVFSNADPTQRDSTTVRVFTSASNSTCAPATFLADTVRVFTRLDRARSPYRVPVNMVVTGGAILAVDPGVVICVDRTISISFEKGSRLQARGTAAQPIRFTATDPIAPWAGLRFADTPLDTSFVTNALLEYGAQGKLTVWTSAHPVVYDTVRFRQWAGSAVLLARGRISRSTIDTVIGGEAAVYLGQGTKFEATTVRQADSIGVYAADTVRILGGRIEAAAVGLVNLSGARPPAVYQPPRLIANRGVPARLDPKWVAKVAPDSLTQSNYLGNTIDAIATTGTLTADTIRVFGHLGLLVTGLTVSNQALLVARPGARIEMMPDPSFATNGFMVFMEGGRLDARGTFTRPVVFTPRNVAIPFDGITFLGTKSGAPLVAPVGDTTRLSNVIVQFGGATGVALTFSTAGLPAVLDSTRVRRSVGVGLQVAYMKGPVFAIDTATIEKTIRIVRSRVDTSGTPAGAAVRLLASSRMSSSVVRGALGTGIELAEGNVDSVTVTGSGGIGIDILAINGTIGPLTVQRTNLFGNTGVGMNNGSPTVVVFVPNLWWGDPQGPFGSLGDGVSGRVSYTPEATSPYGITTPFPIPPPPP